MKRGRRSVRPHPTSPALLPDDDDILAEILLRLPPHPSSLPIAGAVCKRWRRIVTDPSFLRRFRHQTLPPLHGFFLRSGRFFPTQHPPDRVPPWRFSLDQLCHEPHAHRRWSILCSRHGLVLLCCSKAAGEFLVVHPMTGHRRRVAIADEHKQHSLIAAAVVGVGVAGDDDDDAGCRPFTLVALLAHDGSGETTRLTASVYSSDSGIWSESVSTVFLQCRVRVVPIIQPSSLVGHGLYWLLFDGSILRFDVVTQSLVRIEEQPSRLTTTAVDAEHDEFIFRHWNNCRRWIMPASGDDGHRFCLAILSGVSITFWEREEVVEEVRGASSSEWVLCRTVELDKALPVQLKEKGHPLPLGIMGFDEESRVIFICTRRDGVFMSDVKSMRFKKVSETAYFGNAHPYSSF
ncbi:hypothetical protein HU200_040937 [Digitaria exilis]|uniref:F-box domain-containing protein n=1 Tax=Digitaria exilis TaxID=1010633 RepID=A0A835B4W9_9POAL|nr:hypothetical protein HU200_040937 [Digitaria exilis]